MTLYNDFTGFTFNGHHSSEFHILRVSSGNRYTESLLPSSKEETLDIPQRPGSVLTSAKFTNQVFDINIAFDSIREKDFRALRDWLKKEEQGPLYFDECPYKTYQVKVTGQPKLSYICFDDPKYLDTEKQRVYKGEGTIQFTAFFPYATVTEGQYNKQWYKDQGFLNVHEWWTASGLTDGKVPSLENCTNPGDIDAPWVLKFTRPSASYHKIKLFDQSGVISKFWIDGKLLATSTGNNFTLDIEKQILMDEHNKLYNFAIIGEPFLIPTDAKVPYEIKQYEFDENGEHVYDEEGEPKYIGTINKRLSADTLSGATATITPLYL